MMMKTPLFLAAASALALTACVDPNAYPNDPNARAKNGAIIGGLIGAATGIATAGDGDELKGAIVGGALGAGTGALIGSDLRGLFRWEACEDPRELGRQVGGAVLMGIGGVVAMGCSIGQGLTGFAMLAWSGPVTLAAIGVGATIGLRRLIGGFQPD